MYTVYTLAILGAAFLLWKHHTNKSAFKGGAIHYVIIGLSGAACGALVGAALAITVMAYLVPNKEVSQPINLVAMHSTSGLSGTFILGTGSVTSTVKYDFLARNDDGSLVPGSVNATSMVQIIEDSALNNVGTLTTTTMEADDKSPLFNWALGVASRSNLLHRQFRVPAGTVVRQFNLQ